MQHAGGNDAHNLPIVLPLHIFYAISELCNIRQMVSEVKCQVSCERTPYSVGNGAQYQTDYVTAYHCRQEYVHLPLLLLL
jgi:hypothetical protein